MSNFGVRLVNTVSLLLCLVLITPILLVIVLSFDDSSAMIFPPQNYSLRWFVRFFTDSEWLKALANSFWVAIIAACIATCLGFLGALALVRGQFKNRVFLLAVCLLPLIISPVITAVSLYLVIEPLGLLGSRLLMALGHATLAIPVVVLILVGTFQNIDISLEYAAMGMGASYWYTCRHVVIPLMWPGMLSAFFFGFLTSFDELVIALFLSGLDSATIPVRIWNSLLMNMEPVIAAISTVLIAMTILLLLIELLIRKRCKSGL